jgi:rRNA-processing protein FCF1
MTDALKTILWNYLNTHEGWHTKSSLYVVAESEGYSPETGARRLRELAEENKIQVAHYKGKRNQTLTKYASQTLSINKPTVRVEIINGSPVAIMQ